MGFTSGNAYINDLTNLQGQFIVASNKQNPLSTFLGANDMLNNGGAFTEVGSILFNMSQTITLDAAAQPAVTEAQTLTASTGEYNQPTQNTNVVQVFRQGVKFSDFKLSDRSISGNVIMDDQTILQTLIKQAEFAMLQQKRDYEYSILNGTYQLNSDETTAPKIRGIITACSTNAVNAAGAAISKALINELIADMANNGAEFRNVQIHCSMALKQAIGALYGNPPEDRMVGGIDITRIYTDAGIVSLVWNPNVAATTVLMVDAGFCNLVSNTTPGYAPFGLRDVVFSGQGSQAEVYGKLGIDYGHESKHGKITNVVAS